MKTLFYIIIALMILLLMVTIHEFGHYIVGKILKFKINEFSIGFGPSIFSRKCKNGEMFSVRWIPLGGYCAFEGEDTSSDNEGAFDKQAPWKRILVLIAGGTFNIISGVIFSIILLMSIGYDVVTVKSTEIAVATNTYNLQADDLIYSVEYYVPSTNTWSKILCKDMLTEEDKEYYLETSNGTYLYGSYLLQFVYDNIPVEETGNRTYKVEKLTKVKTTDNSSSGDYYSFGEGKELYYKDLKSDKIEVERVKNDTLLKNDVIYRVNGKRVGFNPNKQISQLIKTGFSKDNKITLTIKRNGKMQDIECVGHSYTINTGSESTTQTSLGINLVTYKYNFFEALGRSVGFTFEICGAVLQILGELLIGKVSPSTIGGPVTTIATIAGFSQKSMSSILILLPLIAANLGVFNLMPIPALDGSKVVFCIIEWIRKKPINKDIENKIHTIGLLVLFGLVILADLYQLFFANILKILFG